MQTLHGVPRPQLVAQCGHNVISNNPLARATQHTRHALATHSNAYISKMRDIDGVIAAGNVQPSSRQMANPFVFGSHERHVRSQRVAPLAAFKSPGHQLRPSEIVKFHLGLMRRSSSFLRSCTLRRILRILQTFLDSYSAFDAERVIWRVMYDADIAFESAAEAVERLAGMERGTASEATPYPRTAVIRRYTVTHSDETGILTTSVGSEYDQTQLKSLKQRLFRDRILGELVFEDSAYALHLYAYVAGKYLLWPCPPAVRSYIFQRDINLVVESIVHADMDFLEAVQVDTAVFLHLESDSHEDLNETVIFAKVLGDKSTWALGASDSSKLRLTNFWDRCAAALYSWAVLRKDRQNDACGEACNVSCSLDHKDTFMDVSADEA